MPKEIGNVESYSNKMPFEARRAIDGLNSEVRQAIAMALSEHGRLRFSDVQALLGISKPDLAFHLNRLVESGIISRIHKMLPSEDGQSYYRLSELGKGLIKGIERAFVPLVQTAGHTIISEPGDDYNQAVTMRRMIDYIKLSKTRPIEQHYQSWLRHRAKYRSFSSERREVVMLEEI